MLGTIAAVALAGCGSDGMSGPGGQTADVVTIKFLRHDNPNYLQADKEFFLAYMAEHPNVKIEDTTVPFNTLDASLSADLKRDQFDYDLVLVPPSHLCAYASHVPTCRPTSSRWPRRRTRSLPRRWRDRPVRASSRACRSNTTSNTAAWW